MPDSSEPSTCCDGSWRPPGTAGGSTFVKAALTISNVLKKAVKQMYRRRARRIKLVKLECVRDIYSSAYWEVLFPFSPHSDDVSNWPFLFPFPSSFIILSSPAPLRRSPSFVLMFEFSLADRLSQIISFNSPRGTKTHSPCNFLIILFPFEAPECRLVRCQLYAPSAGGGNVFRRTTTGLFSQIKGN